MPTSIRNSIAATIAAAVLLTAGCGRAARNEAVNAPDIPVESLCTADLALRLGRSLESELIASRDGGMRYSHIGIIIRSDTGAVVVHIEPSPFTDERVRCDSAKDFFSSDRAATGAVMRLGGLDDRQKAAIEDYARRLSDSPITFDHDYSLADSTRMYCTELAERAFATVGISLSQGRRHKPPLAKEPVILPSDIARNDSLATIWSFDNSRHER